MRALGLHPERDEESRAFIQAALATSGWIAGRELKDQPQSFTEQFGYAQSYFGSAFQSDRYLQPHLRYERWGSGLRGYYHNVQSSFQCYHPDSSGRSKERHDLIEHQLAHTVRDPNGRTYNRT